MKYGGFYGVRHHLLTLITNHQGLQVLTVNGQSILLLKVQQTGFAGLYHNAQNALVDLGKVLDHLELPVLNLPDGKHLEI